MLGILALGQLGQHGHRRAGARTVGSKFIGRLAAHRLALCAKQPVLVEDQVMRVELDLTNMDFSSP